MTVKLSKNGKRLGRPPKSSTGKVFISQNIIKPIEEKPEEIDPNSMIECELMQVPQFSFMNSQDVKSGRYMTSIYSIEDFGRKCWVVGAYISADWEKHPKTIATVKKCINYLNTIGKKKKKYGTLRLYNQNAKFLEKFGKKVVVVEMIIDERRNENFWGEGERV